MIKRNRFFATSFAVLCGACICNARAAQNAPTVMSKYGEIQSVNKYSSNPFWTPNSPYNQRFPTPIYATGADLTTGDCNRIVQNLVTEYCANRNYCSNSRISDVRPVVMVQLSQLPGHNFATSCGGYIDSIFEDYKKTYGNSSTNNLVKPVQQTQPTIQIGNPFAQTKTDYEKLVDERTAELERLQNITTPTATVTAANFPKTVDDLSFTDRLANTTAGYEPYKNLNAYKTPKFETEDEYYERMKSVLEHDIHYIGAGAANTGCPTKYLTGRGATVSCTPTRQNGTCTAWCTDAAKTNCPTTHTISPNDRDDKTFYAKCTCNAGYEEQNNKCVKPGTSPDGGGEEPAGCPAIADHRDPTTCQCYKSDFMDSADCGCRGISTWDSASKKCSCPIETYNLATEEWAYVTTMCKCPSTKPTYNSTKHICESSDYALLQCRLKSPNKIKKIGDKIDKSSGAQRYLYDCENAINNHGLLDYCFTPCKKRNEKGYVNAIFESAVNNGDFPEFCTGREGDMPINFFMDAAKFDSGANPLLLTHGQASAIMKGFRDFNGPVTQWAPGPRINEKCNDPKPRTWVLYMLKKLGDKEYEIVDREVLSHNELLSNQ